MHFKGKVAIVTGGSSGIGKETAKRLAAHGASVVLSGRDEAKLHSAAKEVSSDPGQVRVLAGDIGKPTTGVALVDFAEKEFGGLDVLVSNAGVFKPKPFLEVSEEEYDWFLDTILKGKFFLAQAAAKAMKKRGEDPSYIPVRFGPFRRSAQRLLLRIPRQTRVCMHSFTTSRLNWPPTKSESMPSRRRWWKLPSTLLSSLRTRFRRYFRLSTLSIHWAESGNQET